MAGIFDLCSTLYTTVNNLRNQEKFLINHIHPLIQDALNNNDGTLDAEDCNKINRYYGLAVPAVIAEAICVLHGIQLSQKERWASTCQGAMTGIFDDFLDNDDLSANEIAIKLIPEKKKITGTKEKLFDYFFMEAISHVPDRTAMLKTLQQVHAAQIESLAQRDTISPDKIKEITRLKGGSSLLFYRTAINIDPTEQEIILLFEAGALMQLCNDIFDVNKDREEKINTLATVNNLNDLQEYFYSSLSAFRNLLWELSLPVNQKQKFFNLISIAVFNRTMVVLQQFQRIQKREKVFNVNQLSRKELICDMDSIRNKIRSAIHFVKT